MGFDAIRRAVMDRTQCDHIFQVPKAAFDSHQFFAVRDVIGSGDVRLAGGDDRYAIGGGDSAVLLAWEGQKELPQSLQYGTTWEEHYRDWVGKSFGLVRGSLARVPGDVVHLYLGSRQNRQCVERYQIFHDHAYDPVRDVAIDSETGLLQWSVAARQRKPDLLRRVAEYFEQRREDE